MPEGSQVQEILVSLSRLEQGQQFILDHLTILNGKVAKHEESINSIVIWKAYLQGTTVPFKLLWAVLISAISGLLVWILTKSR